MNSPKQADDTIHAILESRAKALAKSEDASTDTGKEAVVFRLGSELYGIEASRVNGIHQKLLITRVPQTPSHFMGIGNLRGEPLGVFDLKQILGAGQSDAKQAGGLLVIGDDEPELGFPVDEVTGVRTIAETDLHAMPESGENEGKCELVHGVTPDALAILNCEALLQHPKTTVESTI